MLSVGGVVYGIAVNAEEDKLYIADHTDGKIVETSLDGSVRRILINCTGVPWGLTVDLNRR